MADGKLLGICKGHKRGVWQVLFSTYDQVLATCSADKTIKIWNLSDFTCLKVKDFIPFLINYPFW